MFITEIHFARAYGPYPLGCIVSRDGGSASVASLAGSGMTWHASRKKHGEVRYIALPEPAHETDTRSSIAAAACCDEPREAWIPSIREGIHS